ncbi:MAG: DNA repair protein RecO [Alphaproteobacteria bacterium]|nr:DNA repair protein RecO [Alphaproteobacteria bacterium]
MEFVDEGFLLAARGHGENHAVAEIFTASHGRWAGLVYGGQGTKMRPLLQQGNRLRATWKGRIADSLGHFALELEEPVAAAHLYDRLALTGLAAACAVAAAALPEREAHPGVYDALRIVIDHLDAPDIWPALLARWELGLLAAIGFGLTLDRCAATGARDDLVYVSPKSAQAVSAAAGEPYSDRLLRLPPFLRGGASLDGASVEEAIDALTLTGYFVETRVFHPSDRTLPDSRMRLVDLLKARVLKPQNENG